MTKRQQKLLTEARIQRAITGLQIPMMQITTLYKQLENGIANGATDNELRAHVILFLQLLTK